MNYFSSLSPDLAERMVEAQERQAAAAERNAAAQERIADAMEGMKAEPDPMVDAMRVWTGFIGSFMLLPPVGRPQ